jgi:hypothetical protein
MGKSDSNTPSSGNGLGTDYVSYPMFKGRQRPLEFMGVQGRYIYWAAGTVGGGVIGFILGYCIFGFLVGLAVLVAILVVGASLIFVKQRMGLHTKKMDKGILIYAGLKKL